MLPAPPRWTGPLPWASKKAPAATGAKPDKDLWEELKLSDSRAAGRQCFPRSILAKMVPIALAERPQQPISCTHSLAKPPLELPCFIGTSPRGILGFGGRQVAELDCLPALQHPFDFDPLEREMFSSDRRFSF